MKALTDEQIAAVRLQYRMGYSTSEIAAQYYVCRTTIWHYVNGIKALGNSVAIPCVDFVMRGIKRVVGG